MLKDQKKSQFMYTLIVIFWYFFLFSLYVARRKNNIVCTGNLLAFRFGNVIWIDSVPEPLSLKNGHIEIETKIYAQNPKKNIYDTTKCIYTLELR